jgi:UDP-N-acetylmuramate dehydrogenase
MFRQVQQNAGGISGSGRNTHAPFLAKIRPRRKGRSVLVPRNTALAQVLPRKYATAMRHIPTASLKELCTYRIGGTAEVFVPESIAEMVDLIHGLRRHGRPFWILGGGANTLFADGHLPMPVISTRGLSGYAIHGTLVSAEAGVWLDRMVAATVRRGLGGLEALSGIPGTIGGALVMNAGAYGAEVSNTLESVTVLAPDGTIATLPRSACGFAYRRAKGLEGHIVLSASWRLAPQDPTTLANTRREILKRRRTTQPLEFPSAGSVFRRPPGDYASRLVDAAGLKGTAIGGAQVSEKHAGFIINRGGATCAQVLALIALCQHTVAERFGIQLDLEQCLCPPSLSSWAPELLALEPPQ